MNVMNDLMFVQQLLVQFQMFVQTPFQLLVQFQMFAATLLI